MEFAGIDRPALSFAEFDAAGRIEQLGEADRYTLDFRKDNVSNINDQREGELIDVYGFEGLGRYLQLLRRMTLGPVHAIALDNQGPLPPAGPEPDLPPINMYAVMKLCGFPDKDAARQFIAAIAGLGLIYEAQMYGGAYRSHGIDSAALAAVRAGLKHRADGSKGGKARAARAGRKKRS